MLDAGCWMLDDLACTNQPTASRAFYSSRGSKPVPPSPPPPDSPHATRSAREGDGAMGDVSMWGCSCETAMKGVGSLLGSSRESS